MRRQILFFIWLLAGFTARAQYTFVPGQTHDFGTVETWRNDPAVFHLVNTGRQNLAILKMTGSKNIVAEYPKNYIAPGDTAHIILRYYTPTEGPFSEEVEIMLSAAAQPLRLTLKGKIRTIGSDALTACPGTQLQGTPPNFSQSFVALDAQTGKAIPGTLFYMGSRGEAVDRFRLPTPGRAVTKIYSSGMYVVRVEAEGYHTLDTGIVILAGQRAFTFYLSKSRQETPPLAQVPEAQVPETPAIPVQPAPVPLPTPVPSVPEATARWDSTETNAVLPLERFRPNNIVFVLDVSASMRILGRIDMLKAAMLHLTQVLRRADKVTIITFTTSPLTRIQGVGGHQKDTLNAIIRSLNASGATNGIRGLRFAYELAERHFIAEGNNMVIIGTDGVFAQTDENGISITTLVEEYLAKDIKLGVMAFGRDEAAIQSMERMAHKGKGGFMRMNNPENATPLLLEQIKEQSERR